MGIVVFFQNKVFINERERFITVSIYVNKEPAVISPISRNSGDTSASERDKTLGNPLPQGEISKDALIEERIHEIKAKKRIEKLARLRAEITETIKNDGRRQISKTATQEQNQTHYAGRNRGDYIENIKGIIQKNWHYPELGRKGLRGTVVIFIRKNGVIDIIDFKSSGERLFDISVKNAILKSSPLPVPPEETEIELRFSR